MFIKLSQRHKLAQAYRDPEQTAASIVNMIHILSTYLPSERQSSFRNSVRQSLSMANATEIASKNMPAGARIGQAITFVKNFLNGQEAAFISDTISRIVGKL